MSKAIETRWIRGGIVAVAGLLFWVLASVQPFDAERQMAELSNDGVSLVFAGDTLFGRSFSGNDDPQMIGLFKIFRDADASFINLEQVMSSAGSADPDVGTLVRADPGLLRDIQWAGVDAVSLANNHSMNFGAEGLLGTIRELEGLGIRYAGGGRNTAEARSAALVEAGNLKVGLISLYSGTGSTSGSNVEVAGSERPGMFLLRASQVNLGGTETVAPVATDLQAMIEAIETTRQTVDILAISIHMHWGSNTFQEEFSGYHPLVARSAIDAGADLFIIHGPHVPRGIEQYKHGFIAYSVGNLFWNLKDLGIDPEGSPNYVLDEAFQSIVVRAVVRNKRVERLEVVPIYMYREGEHQGIPHLAKGPKGREILDRVQRLSAETRTELRIVDWYGVVEADLGESQED